ncbi:tumor necrosis factor receptor superfamily member 14-like isoform X2 [Dicentrarchus labrax]|uniref:tumor necrosis factor receptor superfamily member 14-like isoform X2 n=2 Tax=Dicentrarchus labrax TaxID=13489 RepID=UPI0021F510E3|nr:tumor necrosis factor receptor superfamily member 14-like isoform X2 [Dicentrarchus labrax]
MKTVIQQYKMMFGRKPLTAAPLLILVMNIFRGHALPCHPSEYQRGNECCPKCLPGSRVKTDCTEFRSTSCLSCTEGTFMNQPTGLTQCFSCTICDAGSGLKIKKSCTTTSDTVCEPLEGFYCFDSREDGCMSVQRHTLCQPGQYISQKGTALTDTECSDCSAGTYSNGTFPSCQPHTQCESTNLLIKAGTVSTDAQCGEQSSNPTGIVVGVVLVVLLFTFIGGAAFVLWKKGCLNISCITKRRKNVENPNPVEETSVMVSDRCPQQQVTGPSFRTEMETHSVPLHLAQS